ncbi:hypothetical protein DFH09DRAFT_1041862 [Mycena vulgaris]|nr:hypothetical protein DFH09DRAFT_1041862 [Mycena vulgaris]
MTGGVTFNSILGIASLTSDVTSGTAPPARLDQMVTRILAAWYRLGQDSVTRQ